MAKKAATGVRWNIIVPLAAFGLIRTFLHIFRVVEVIPSVEGLAWLGTATVWISLVVLSKTPRPIFTLTLVGLVYGVLSVFIQQLFWSDFWSGYPPVQIGGALMDVHSSPVRAIAMVCGVVTGTGWGLLCGIVAHMIGGGAKPKAKKKR